jgi:hypothetical protein
MQQHRLSAFIGLLILTVFHLSAQVKSFSEMKEQERAGLVQFYHSQWGAVVDNNGYILTTADALSTPYFDFGAFASKQAKGDSIAFSPATSRSLPWEGESPKLYLGDGKEGAISWMYVNDLTVVATGHLKKRPWVLLQSKSIAKKSKKTWAFPAKPLSSSALYTGIQAGSAPGNATTEGAQYANNDYLQAYGQLFSMVAKSGSKKTAPVVTYQQRTLNALQGSCPMTPSERAAAVTSAALARGTAALTFASDVLPLMRELLSKPTDTLVKKQIARVQKSFFEQYDYAQDESLANNAFFLAYNVYPASYLPELLANYKNNHPDLYRATKSWYENSLFTDVVRFNDWVNAPNQAALDQDALHGFVQWNRLGAPKAAGNGLVFTSTNAEAAGTELTQIAGIRNECAAPSLPMAIKTTLATAKKVKAK